MALCIDSATTAAAPHLELLRRLFQFSYLSGRATMGQLNASRAQQLAGLKQLFEGDTFHGQRRNRRYGTYLPALVTAGHTRGHAILRDLSSGGVQLTTALQLPPGTEIQVRLGRPAKLEYVLFCRVARVGSHPRHNILACTFTGPPLELACEPERQN